MNAIAETPRYAGVDDGHFGIKIVDENGGQFYLPSRVAEGAQVISLSGDEDNVWDTQEGQTYTVSDSLAGIDTRFSDYGLSDINRVLVHHALYKAGYGGQSVRIVTGLPVNDYYVGHEQNADFIRRKVDNLAKLTATNRNQTVAMAKITGHAVVSEAIAAFFDLLFNMDGTVNEAFHQVVQAGPIGILDVGGKTTDSAVIINGGKGIDASRSGTSKIGALSLNQGLENRIKSLMGVAQLTPTQIESAARTGMVRMFGKETDVSEIVNEEKRILADQIVAEAKRKMRDGADLECVYFVGGGSLLLREQLADLYPHAVFVDDPQFANARGMLKIAKYVKG